MAIDADGTHGISLDHHLPEPGQSDAVAAPTRNYPCRSSLR